MPIRRHRQGLLRLVLIGSASAGLAGCSDEPDAPPEQLFRPMYASAKDCEDDWGSGEACEPANPSPGGGTHTGHWWGPYYSANRVYHYDGRVTPLARPPTRAGGTSQVFGSPTDLWRGRFTSPGSRYLTTPRHASASPVRIAASRGGFGSTGSRSFSGG